MPGLPHARADIADKGGDWRSLLCHSSRPSGEGHQAQRSVPVTESALGVSRLPRVLERPAARGGGLAPDHRRRRWRRAPHPRSVNPVRDLATDRGDGGRDPAGQDRCQIHRPNAPGGELDTALLAGLLGLLFIGPGRFSLDSMMGMETIAAPSRSLRDRVGTKH